MTSQCPCGTGKNYEECCGRFISGVLFATTAEELMRSRYTAFVRMDRDYLMQTWHPRTLPRTIHLSPTQVWTGLKVSATTGGGLLDDKGTVDFKASYVEDGLPDSINEVSEFERLEGKWVYVDGQQS